MNILSQKSEEGATARAQVMDFHIDQITDRLTYLYGRWQDEREYEDWSEYKTEIEKLVPEEGKLFRVNKRPFGFTFQPKDFPYAVIISVTSKYISWKPTQP